MLNRDMLSILHELSNHTLLGINKEKYWSLMMTQVYAYKGVDLEGEDLDQIINDIFGEEVAN